MPTYEYLKKISGLAQKITPQEGRASISGVSFELVDVDGAITEMIAADSTNLHRKKIQIDAGYIGLDAADMTTVFTGYLTGLKTGAGNKSYIFTATDSTKWGQNKIFRRATTSTPITRSGNPLTLMLEILTGTGLGTNGAYDSAVHGADEGLGMASTLVNIAEIEALRDAFFAGNTYYMRFSFSEAVVGKDFIEKEILKPLNLYPYIDGTGRFSVKAVKPPTVSTSDVQSITDDHIIGAPEVNLNFEDLVTLIEFNYNWDGSEFDSKHYYYDSDAVAARGVGKKAITINSKGWRSSNVDMNLIMESRKNSIFDRYNPPPLKISLRTTFDRWLTEYGDVVPVTSKLIPNLETGEMGITARQMEVISKAVDWIRGTIKFTLLDTGFARGTYATISPIMTVVSADAPPSSSSEVLLVHSNTTDESTTFEDSSPSAHSASAPVGAPSHQDTQKKFGATSMYFDGNDALRFGGAGETDFAFGSGDFTIDFWIYPLANTADGRIVTNYNLTGGVGWILTLKADNTIRLQDNSASVDLTTALTAPDSQWTHVAIVGSGGTIKIYLDGTADTNTATQGTLSTPTGYFQVALIDGQSTYYGKFYLDELRILKGAAAWTANFTPETSPYTPAPMEIEVSAADAALYAGFTDPEIQIINSKGRQLEPNITITGIDGTTLTVDGIGFQAVAGDIIEFADFSFCTAEQLEYCHVEPTGADDYLIIP